MENRYEGNLTDYMNLLCKECHGITDDTVPIAIDSREVTRKTKFWVTDTRLEYYGYCQKCRKKSLRYSTKSTLQLHKRQCQRQVGVLEELYTCLPAGREAHSPGDFMQR
jgi:hypothetical protein